MSKRTLLMVVALIAAVAIAATGTLAYLTDTDSDVNVMTLGNVDIEQHELERKPGVADDATLAENDLVPFTQNQPLFPAYAVNGSDSDYQPQADELVWGPYVTEEDAASPLWDEELLTGALDKFVFVENTGASDAFVRTFVAIEAPVGVEDKILINKNEDLAWTELGYFKMNGVRYQLLCATYEEALAPGAISAPSLLQVALHHSAGNEDMAKLGDTYEVLTLTQAVQTANLEELGAEGALNAAFGEPSVADHPWLKDDGTLSTIRVATQEEFDAAVKNAKPGDSIILGDGEFKLNGKMKEGVSYTGSGNTVISNPSGNALSGSLKNVTISNMTIEGSNALRYCYATGDVVLDNCTITGDVYGIHFDGGSGNVILRNCDITGWNSFGSSLKSVTVEGCRFYKDAYGSLRFFQNATVTNCTFASDFNWIDASNNDITVKLANCTYEGGNMEDLLFTRNGYTGVTWILDGTELTNVPTH